MKKIGFRLKSKDDFSNKIHTKSKEDLGHHIVFFSVSLLLVIIIFVLTLISGQYLNLLLLIVPVVGIVLAIYHDIMISKYNNTEYSIDDSELTLVRDGNTITVKRSEIKIDDIIILSKNDIVPAGLIILEGNLLIDGSNYSDYQNYTHKTKDEFLELGTKIIDGNARCRVVRLLDMYQPVLKFKSRGLNRFINIAFISLILFVAILSFITLIVCKTTFQDVNNYSFGALVVGMTLMVPYDFFLFTTLRKVLAYKKLKKNGVALIDVAHINNFNDCDVVCFDKLGIVTDGDYDIKEIIPLNGETTTFIKSTVFRILNTTITNDPLLTSLSNNVTSVNNEKATSSISIDANNKYMYASFSDGSYVLGDPNYLNINGKSTLLRQLNDYTSKGYTVIALAKGERNVKNQHFICIGIIILEDHIKETFIDVVNWAKEEGKEFKIICSQNAVYLKEHLKNIGINECENYISLKGMSDEEVCAIADKFVVFGEATSYQKELIVKTLESKKQKVLYVASALNSLFALEEAHYSLSLGNSRNAIKNATDAVLDGHNVALIKKLDNESKKSSNYLSKLLTILFSETVFSIVVTLVFLFARFIFGENEFENTTAIYAFYFLKVIVFYPALIMKLFDNNTSKNSPKARIIAGTLFGAISLSLVALLPFILYMYSKTSAVYTGVPTLKVAYNMSLIGIAILSFFIVIKNAEPNRKNLFSFLVIMWSLLFTATYLLIGMIGKSDNYWVVPNTAFFSGYNYFLILIFTVSAGAFYFIGTYILGTILGDHLDVDDEEVKE